MSPQRPAHLPYRGHARVVAEADVASLPYFRLISARIAGRPVEISRTGYTGDLGYEIWVRSDDAPVVWQAIMEAGADFGLTPAGMLALDIARIEAGLLLVDVDYTPAHKALIPAQKSTPYELGLGWAVKLDKPGYFVGREALAAPQEAPAWQFRGLIIDWSSLEQAYNRVGLPVQAPHTAWRHSIPLYSGRNEAGYATSGCFSPLLKQYIALATLRTPYAAPGTQLEMEITVEHMRRRSKARVVNLPFFDPPRKKQ